MKRTLPLLFSFKQVVQGKGFIAGVQMDGRALLEESEGEIWITGVAPAGIAAGGADRVEAFFEFRAEWVRVLFDIAHDSQSFAEFDQETRRFLGSESSEFTKDWTQALAEVRQHQIVDTLPRVPADKHIVNFNVQDLTAAAFGPDENTVEAGLRAAA